MECFRCSKRDFKVVRHCFFTYAYIECSHCWQGYLVYPNMKLVPAEVLGNTAESVLIMRCHQCNAKRFIGKNEVVTNSQYCDRCISEAKKTNSVTKPAGKKLSWEEFLNK